MEGEVGEARRSREKRDNQDILCSKSNPFSIKGKRKKQIKQKLDKRKLYLSYPDIRFHIQ